MRYKNNKIIILIIFIVWIFIYTFANAWEEVNHSNKSSFIKTKIEYLKKKIKLEKIIKLHKYKKLESNKKNYPEMLDISNKMKYKSIQKKSLSCELSATADIISYFENKKVNEDFIEKVLEKSYYNKLPETIRWVRVWWYPNSWYVWYIWKEPSWEDAEQYNYTWYWVLEKPINEIFKKLNYKTKVITKNNYSKNYTKQKHLTQILQSLNAWSLVQLWWDYCTKSEYEDTSKKNNCKYIDYERKLTWYYKKDKKLLKYEWLIWEHAFYLLWYKWGVNNPTHIIVWDTKTWKHTYPTKEWMRKWDRMQNRSIIIKK